MARRFWYPERPYIDGVAANVRAISGEPSSMAGIVRDEALLQSAIGIPKLPYYRTTIDKAGALLRSLVKNHPFVDGNKRVAVVTTIGFLSANGYITTASDEDIVEFTLRLARSEPDMPLKDVVSWIRAHVQQTDSFLRAELDS